MDGLASVIACVHYSAKSRLCDSLVVRYAGGKCHQPTELCIIVLIRKRSDMSPWYDEEMDGRNGHCVAERNRILSGRDNVGRYLFPDDPAEKTVLTHQVPPDA